MHKHGIPLLFASPVTSVSAQSCRLQFDGRVPPSFGVAGFDTPNNFFSETNVLGAGLSFSQLIQLPAISASLFDIETIPIEVTISDASIFNGQTGFRRAELLPASNSGIDNSTTGIKTLHFSIGKDAQRPLNLSHEYQLVFFESNDFSTNQFVLKTGSILGGDTAVDPDILQLFGNVNQTPSKLLFSVPFLDGVFTTLLTTQVFFSAGGDPLEAVTQVISNDVSGQGQFHFGLLKKPTDAVGDITRNRFQEDGIDEGIIFGGIFQEDSSAGCVSLRP
ncbi:Putative protein of unknown function [Podospora comata]|uniref:Glycoside hydrolase 131 catalytic N-terminal domain-containing protein n=1 Tax=Podospora comata TaxID=48703 RepID=A0ABY6S6J9_PODCO|nr:Putative protein of unknown function [Podospora comata]